MNDHVILCGLGKVGISILDLLRTLDEPVVAISREMRPEWRQRAQRAASRLITGDARDEGVLEEADVRRARAIVIATDDDLANLEIALDARRLAPSITVVVRIYDLQIAEGLQRDARPWYVLNAARLSAPAFVAAAMGKGVLRAFQIGDTDVNIVSLQVTDTASGAGRSLADMADRLGVIPLAARAGYTSHALAPSLDSILAPGDEVVVAASRRALDDMARTAGRSDKARGARARRSRRRWRRAGVHPLAVPRRIWGLASSPLRFAMAALVSLAVVSTGVFHYTLALSWLDAFYFTVTIVTTVGFGDYHLMKAPPAVKLFGTGVMMSSVALGAIFFGIVTDYLLRRRFDQALGRKHTTLARHVVVVGIGHVGHIVALRLHELGERVLVVERDGEGEFVSRMPRDISVLVGDADLPHMMEQAGIAQARAVVAVTDNDLTNLRVGQHARALNSSVRTVVRLFHSALADKLGASELGIDQPINPSQAAAATFVACALMPDVLQGFTLGGRLLVLRWLDAARLGQCAGQTVGTVRERTGITVLLRQAAGAQGLAEARAGDVVQEGDRLVVIEEYRPGEHTTAPCGLAVVGDGARVPA